MRQVAARRPQPPFWAGLKFFNVFGPNEYHKGAMQSVVAKIFPDAAAGRPATLFRSHRPDYADGGQLRDFVWVEDAVAVMLWLADRALADGGQTGKQPRRGLYNIGSGKARSFADLAAA